MNANTVIQQAKLIYPVETFLDTNLLVSFVNEARERVNKLAKLTYAEHYFSTVADTWRYQLSKSFYDIYRVYVYINNAMLQLQKIMEGEATFRDNMKGFPYYYSFIPMDRITLYPCPNDAYTIYIYGTTTLPFQYTVSNMSNVDIIPDNFITPLSFDVAKRIALFDQQYELARLFDNEFLLKMKECKM